MPKPQRGTTIGWISATTTIRKLLHSNLNARPVFFDSLRTTVLSLCALAVGLSSLYIYLYTPAFTPVANAAANETINFQARLLSNTGALVPDGYYNVEFKLYSVSSGGTALWTDTRYDTNGVTAGNDYRVQVKNGYLTVSLADTTAGGTAFPGTIDWSQELWLSMNIGGTTQTATPTWNGEMSPRMKVTAVPYAFAAKEAQQLKVTDSGFTSTISVTTPTANRTITFADQSGTVVLDSTLTTEGDIYYRNGSGLARLARGANGECLTSNATTILWGSCGSGSTTLQGAYDAGTAGDQVIALDDTQDSLIFRNPSSNGSNGTGYVLTLDQLATGAMGGLDIQSAGTGNLLRIRDTTATATDVLTVADGGAVTLRNQTDSTAALRVQNAAGSTLLSADTTNQRIGVNVTYTSMSAPTGLAVAIATTGGSLTASTTYYYVVTAIDSAGGETTASSEASRATTAGNRTLPVTWNAVTGASGYKVYRSTTSGAEVYLTTVLTNSFTDSGAIAIGTGSAPGTNTAYVSTNVASSNLQLAVGGNGTPTGQVYISGKMPSAAVGSAATGTSPAALDIDGKYAYLVNSSSDTLQIFDISNPVAPVVIGSVATGNNPTHITVSGRYAYVPNNLDDTLQVFDISNPVAPVSVGVVATNDGPWNVQVVGRYAYVNNYSANTLQIIDVSNPTMPTSVTTISSNGISATDLVVQGRYVYIMNSSNLSVFDVSNPASPSLSGSVSLSGAPSSVEVSGRYAYVTRQSSDILQIFDISNPASITSVGTITTGDQPSALTLAGRYAYVTNAAAQTLEAIDISNPAAGFSVGSVATGGSSPLEVKVQGRYAYVLNNSGNSLKIFDIGGTYSQSVETGALEAANAAVTQSLSVGQNVTVGGGLTASSAQINGGLGVTGAAMFKNANNSTTAVTVQNASGLNLLNIDTATASTNLVSNNDFETNTTGWAQKGTATLSRVTGSTVAPYTGTAVMRAVTSAADSGAKFDYSLSANTTYTLTATLRGSASYSTLALGRQDVSGSDIDCLTSLSIVSTEWRTFTCTFTTGGTITSSNIYIKDTTTAHTFYIDQVQLVAGSAPYSAGQLSVGGIINTPTTFRNSTNSNAAFQIQNASNNQLFTVDTVNNQVNLGAPGSGGVDGKLVFNNDTNTNTVALLTGTTTTSYTLTLPTALGASGDCLKDTTGTGVLGFDSCGGGSLFTDGGTFTYLTSTTDDLILGATTVANATFFFDTSASMLYLGTNEGANGGLTLYSSGAGITDATITTNSSGDLNLSAPSGAVVVGDGSGDILFQLSNPADVLEASKIATISASYSDTDFSFLRTLTNGNNTQTIGGTVLSVVDTSVAQSGTTVNYDLISGNANPSGASFSGNLLRLQTAGVDQLTVSAGGTLNLATGALATAGTTRLTNGGTLQNVTYQGTAIGAQYGGTGINTSASTGVPSISSGTWSVNAQLPLSLGGTNAALTASNGGIVYSNSTQLQILAGTGTAGQCLLSGSNAAPSWGSCGSGGSLFTDGGTFTYLTATTDDLVVGDTTVAGASLFVDESAGSVTIGNTSLAGSLLLNDGNGQTTTIVAGDSTGNISFTLPTDVGAANNCLKNSGTAGILTFANCNNGSGGGGAITLDDAYEAGNEIITSDARNILFTLGDTATDSDFIVNMQGTGNIFEVQDGGSPVLTIADGGGATFTGTVTASGANSLLLGTTGSNNGGITYRSSNAASGTTLLQVSASKDGNNRTLTLPDATGTLVVDTMLTTEGDIYYRNGSGLARLARGSNGDCLLSNTTTIVWGACTGGGSGVTTVGTFSGSSQTNGANITGTTITFGPADGTNPGMVTTGTQTLAGAKTFSSLLTGSAGLTVSGAAVSINASSNFSTSINTGTSTGAVTIGNASNTNNTVTIVAGATGGINLNSSLWQRTASGTTTLNLSDAANTVLAIQNSGAGVTNLTLDGAITAGAWQGTAVGAQYGGTGINTSASTGVPSISSGTWSVNAQLGISLGGTGASTSQGAINAISQLTTNGDLLYHNGTNSTRLARGSNGQCLTSNATTILWGSCSGGASTLQATYDADTDTGDTIIALTTADDSIILRNPAASGTDSTYILTLDQLATGAKGGLDIQSAGTGNLLRITDTTATASDVLTVADGGAITFKNQTDSQSAFAVQRSAGTALLTVDSESTTNVLKVQIGSSTGDSTGIYLTVDSYNGVSAEAAANGSMYYDSTNNKFKCRVNGAWVDCDTTGGGGGSSAKKITLVPEYSGGVIKADGTNNNGTMTTDYLGSLTSGQGYKHNYYEWTTSQATAQDYDIVVNHQLPSDFNASTEFDAGTWKVWTYVDSNTDAAITMTVYDNDGTACANGVSIEAGTTGWSQITLTDFDTNANCDFTADSIITISINMSSVSPSTNKVRVAEIQYGYTN